MKVSIVVLLSILSIVLARAPLHVTHDAIEGSYIIVLNDTVSADLRDAHIQRLSSSEDYKVTAVWTIVNGYAANMNKATLESILLDPLVKYVEQDHPMYATQNQVSVQELGSLATGLWGLNRIWQRTRSVTTQYQYFTTAGSGVDAYIVDTGLYASHNEFTGRQVAGYTAVSETAYPGTLDGNGHGTHVASTTAGTQYGVAKLATLIPVKVLTSSGSGTTAGVINGVNWVATSYNSRRRPSVANMSLGGSASATLDQAVQNSVTAGVFFAVAAGNDNANACNSSPARATSAFTVGATTNTDARSSFSNFGTCVNIFAPGSNILGAWYNSPTATNTISGTSMASPHVAGAAALYLGRNPSATPNQVRTALVNAATPNVITSPGTGSPNALLYTLSTASN